MVEAGASALECQGLTKRFGGLEAVRDINLRVSAGERRAIIGPNGAGKTTLFNLISGEIRATGGQIKIFGRDITRMPSHRRVYLGLGRTFQITNLFPTLTLLENLLIAAMGLKRMKFSMLRPLSTYRDIHKRAQELLESVGMAGKAKEPVKNLSHGEQRQVEIALALITNPTLVLLDEPTAGLSPAESAMMTGIIQKFDPSITVLIIEHDMDVAYQVADQITVLYQGFIFAEGNQSEISNNPKVQEIYLGEEESC
ncbi:MAG: ABC transporter ATP-binding protein [Deltaproteobacteria bacterium]|nr:ABC transporter ATP-binding protein [Deltaproteobacteria bacterium]